MQIKEFSQTENKDFWIGKIAQADWSAGKYLGQILCDGSFYDLYENFGFEFLQEMQDRRGDMSLVYKRCG